MYDVLREYRQYVGNSFSKETARAYRNRLALLLRGQDIIDPMGNMDFDRILDNLSMIRHKNYFSQTKNAFLKFCEFEHIALSSEVMNEIKALQKSTHKKYRKLSPVDYREIKKKVEHLKNVKLKLSYQTMASTGLRVSELAGITAHDCMIENDGITFTFKAKGGRMAQAVLLAHEYPQLYASIKEQIEKTSLDKKVFYSANYLQGKAKGLKFQCHDLRRAFAKIEYKKSHSKIFVMEKLRHKHLKTTEIYLKSRVKV